MKILVAGGAGFLGINFIRQALVAGYQIISLDIVSDHDALRHKNLIYHQVDISDRESVKSLLYGKEFEYVINFSGCIDHSSFRNGGASVLRSHFLSLMNLLEALNWNSVKKFIHISTSDEYGFSSAPQVEDMLPSPFTPYSFAKSSGTSLIKYLGVYESLPVLSVRLFLVYGPMQKSDRFIPYVIRNCLLGNDVVLTNANHLRDFCYIDDVINGFFKLFEAEVEPGDVINIASGNAMRVAEVAEMIRSIIGSGNIRLSAKKDSRNSPLELYADTSKANAIGWRPSIGISDGLEMTIEYYERTKYS